MEPSVTIKRPRKSWGLDDILQQKERARQVLSKVQSRMLAPNATKKPPVFTSSQLAALCGITRQAVNHRLSKQDLPEGAANGPNRVFTLEQTQAWIRAYRRNLRPSGVPGFVLCVAQFKGGVTKTTTSMTLAQGLTLLGYRVLVIDDDPQGSLTSLFGRIPVKDVELGKTLLALFEGEVDSVMPLRRTDSYWSGLDVIESHPKLATAEFALPARQMQEANQGRAFEFWNVLRDGLSEARQAYDFVIIDTSPSPSYATLNALFAADGVVLPVPPNALDFASSTQFWALFGDFADQLGEDRMRAKRWEFMYALPSRVDPTDAATETVLNWLSATYDDALLPVHIPKTAVSTTQAAEFGTVYDVSRYSGSLKTYQRAREAYDRLVNLVAEEVGEIWQGWAKRSSPPAPALEPAAREAA